MQHPRTQHIALPDWHLLMRQWLAQRMGSTGITLPFLAGALALVRAETIVSEDGLRQLVATMISRPVSGYYVGVRRCSDIKAPVLSSLCMSDPLIRQCEVLSPNGQIAIAFSPDAMGSFGGLDCDCASGCIKKLIQYSLPHTEVGNFSRVYDQRSGDLVFSTFRAHEIAFIRSVLGNAAQLSA